MGIRRKAREIALQFLFQRDFQQQQGDCRSLDEEFALFKQSFETAKKSIPYATQLLTGICERLAELDEYIVNHSHNWRLNRMSVIDRNILRVAIYEMRFGADIPARVAINEAVEIAKRFGSEDSAAFINGILDGVRKSIDSPS